MADKDEKKRTGIIMIVMGVIILGLVLYIAFENYSEGKQAAEEQIRQDALREGRTQTIVTIFQRAAQCQQVPVTVQNNTLNLIAVECIQAAQQQQQTT